jgi:hypothetical protein
MSTLEDQQKIEEARTLAAEVEELHSPPLRRPVVIRCNVSGCGRLSKRSYIVLASLLAVVAWGVFFGAVTETSTGRGSHSMHGYEWIPGFMIVPLALVAFCFLPDTPYISMLPAEHRASYEREINTRLVCVVLLVGAGIVGGAWMISTKWYWPPPVYKPVAPPTPTPAPAAAFLHVSPSPSPVPREWVPVPADPVVGTMMVVHYALLGASFWCYWRAAVTPPPRGQFDPAPGDDDV